MAELHPRGLQVVDPAPEHQPAHGVDAEIAQPLRLRGHATVAVELRVLPDEAEGYELREAAGLLLERADEVDVARDVAGRLYVTVHHGRRRRDAEAMRGGDDVDPGADVD